MLSLLVATVGLLPTAATARPDLEPGVWKEITPPEAQVGRKYGLNIFTNGIAIDPSNPLTVYFCRVGYNLKTWQPTGGGVWKTSDGGSTWTNLSQLHQPVHVRVNPTDSNHLYAIDGVRGDTMGFWISRDGGNSWIQPDGWKTLCADLAKQGYPNYKDGYALDTEPGNFDHILVSSHSDWPVIAESFDGGKTWRSHVVPAKPKSGGYSVFFLFSPDRKVGNAQTWLFCTQTDGTYRSTDAGVTWTRLTTINSMNHGGNQIYYTKEGVLFAGSMGSPASPNRSTDNGATWQSAKNLPETTGTMGIIGDGTYLYTGPWTDESGPTLTSLETDGLNWTPYEGGTQRLGDMPFEMAYDKVNGIIYSSNDQAGIWALKVKK